MKFTSTILNYSKTLIASVTIVSFLLFGCAKEEVVPDEPTSPVATPSDFRWTTGGATVIADSSVCYSQITTIFAFKNGTVNTVEINLSDISSGAYNISSTSGNELKFVNSNNNLSASSGTVNITSNSSGRLSGNFSCAFSTGTLNTISGQFTDVRIK